MGPVATFPEKMKKTCSVPTPIVAVAVDGETPDALCGAANRVPVSSAPQTAHANALVLKT